MPMDDGGDVDADVVEEFGVVGVISSNGIGNAGRSMTGVVEVAVIGEES